MPISIQSSDFFRAVVIDPITSDAVKKESGTARVENQIEEQLDEELESAREALGLAKRTNLPDEDEPDFASDEDHQKFVEIETRYELALRNRQKFSVTRILELGTEEMADIMSGCEETRLKMLVDMRFALYSKDEGDSALRARQMIIDCIKGQPESIKSALFCQESVNLSGLDLSGMHFVGMNLHYANFNGANLRHANFEGTDLYAARFDGADATHANFSNVNLQWVRFSETDLSCTRFRQVNFRGVEFHRTILQQADFMEENLSSTKFYQCDLRWANLTRANISNAHFHSIDFRGAKIIDGNLDYASFCDVDFRAATFNGSHLRNVQFFWPNLRGVDFRKTDIGCLDLSGFDLSGSNLGGVCLAQSRLYGTNLFKANLSGTGLSKLYPNGAVWKESDLSDLSTSKNARPFTAFFNSFGVTSTSPQNQIRKNKPQIAAISQIELARSSHAATKSIRPTGLTKITPPSNLNVKENRSPFASSPQLAPKGPSIWRWFSSLPGRLINALKSISFGIWRRT